MTGAKDYGIAPGQLYAPADGSEGVVIVLDVDTYAECSDVLVYDTLLKELRRIDAFKLAKCRYMRLAEPWSPSDVELVHIYRLANGELSGKARPLTTASIFRAMRLAVTTAQAQIAESFASQLR